MRACAIARRSQCYARAVHTPSIAVHADGAISCATVLWQYRGRLQLTVVLKALFSIVPDGVAAPAGPGAILSKDRHVDGNPARSIEASSDLVPYLARCDVLFSGHAYAPGGRAPAGSVRLGISRDGRPLLDKTIHVFGDRGPATPAGPSAPEPFTRIPIVYERALGGIGEPNPVGTSTPNLVHPADPRRPVGFGPISRYWPVRKKLLGSISLKAVDAPIADLPETMPWEFFQAAPPDQQIEHLRGGEWLVLDGLHPALARVQTRLPAVRGAARVSLAGAPERPLDLACDTLAIDGDRQTLALTWRGRCDVVEGDAVPASIAVLAALETPGVAVDWSALRGRPASIAPPAAAPAPAASLLSTALASDTQSTPALPFAPEAPASVLARLPAAAPAPKAKAKASTMALSLDQLPPQPALPFVHVAEAAAEPVPPAPIAGAPWSPAPPPLVPPPPEHDDVTADLDPAEAASLQPPPVIAPPLRDHPPEPPPEPARPATRPPPADPWAKPIEPPPAPAAPKRSQPPPAFERPAAAEVKNRFYAKFKR
jgi:hypothetical protein